jgi:Ca2+-binding EF-hand superfamily protein
MHTGTLQTEDGSDTLALKKLFMRIDANSDGSVDWDEFSNFMLMESQGGASIREVEMSINFEQPGVCVCTSPFPIVIF